MEEFTIKEVLETILKSLKIELYEEEKYKKSCILFDIWVKQKELGKLFDLYKCYEENITMDLGPTIIYTPSLSYKEQYIKFLMQNDLIFLDTEKDPQILISLIYYWLVKEIKNDRDILLNI